MAMDRSFQMPMWDVFGRLLGTGARTWLYWGQGLVVLGPVLGCTLASAWLYWGQCLVVLGPGGWVLPILRYTCMCRVNARFWPFFSVSEEKM